ncbi:MAG: ABC-type phosphate transport system, periplasmic component [Candidatus Magnetoglobus multicellularis str. Araruama]|uniref:ABC-type phosphate transport system, periplasmic component n=1 Tax=Candidatus Magnetoglobus multicellularis str. Araruama TaxID=890399 RepID=A0A1V1PGN4_9BACT|nr:MAG: ABC-type phosphate transport system, periplasmic component [Candidatus Magnetoglobus multicellularis str. Araruama]
MEKNFFNLILICIFLFLSSSNVVAEKLLFIMNNSVQEKVNKDKIKKIYLGRKSKWDNHQRIIFFTFDSSEIITAFTRTFLGKSKHQFDNYWKRQLFTGKGSIPKSIKTLDKALEIIAQTKGSIMFIPSQDQEINYNNIRIISIE